MSKCLTYGSNASLVAVLVTVLFSRCLSEDEQEVWGNMLLLVGQVLVVIATIDSVGDNKSCYNHHFGRDFGGYEGPSIS